jgi:hypothetical protein
MRDTRARPVALATQTPSWVLVISTSRGCAIDPVESTRLALASHYANVRMRAARRASALICSATMPTRVPRRPAQCGLEVLGFTFLVAIVATGGCSSEDPAPKPSGERTREVVPETPKDAPSGPFSAFDFEAASRRLQGTWLVAHASAVWSIEGDRLVIAHGDGRTQSLRWSVYSPCQLALTDDAAGETSYWNFAFDDERVWLGLGPLGRTLGEDLVACDANGQVFVLEGETCSRWSEMFDDWKRQPGKCRVDGQGSERRFVIGEARLEFEGSVLLAPDMREQLAVRHADVEAAKQALAGSTEREQP